jgi:hypothetical protein
VLHHALDIVGEVSLCDGPSEGLGLVGIVLFANSCRQDSIGLVVGAKVQCAISYMLMLHEVARSEGLIAIFEL